MGANTLPDRVYRIKKDAIRVSAQSEAEVKSGPNLSPRELLALNMADEFLTFPPASWLITGYRGVGKTSVLNQVANIMKRDQRAVVVRVNGAVGGKNDDLPRFILRKMQRELCLQLERDRPPADSGQRRRPLSELLPPAVRQELLIAKRQTSEITKTKVVTGRDRGWEFGPDPSKWPSSAAAGLLAAAGAVWFVQPYWQQFSQWLSANYPSVPKLAPFAGALLLYLVPKLKYTASRKVEDEVAPIYDDEVAAESFNRLVSQVSSAQLRVPDRLRWFRNWWGIRWIIAKVAPLPPEPQSLILYFIIDELDKLSQQQIDEVLKGLKSVFFAGNAHIICVSAMHDLYRWVQSAQEEDDLLQGVFTHHRHVGALTSTDFIKFVETQVLAEGEKKDQSLGLLADYLTLLSRGRPRRFIAQLMSRMRWGSSPELVLSEAELTTIDVQARLYVAVADVWAAVEVLDVHVGVKDAMRTQVTLWLERIRRQAVIVKNQIPTDIDFFKPPGSEHLSDNHMLLGKLMDALVETGLLEQTGEQYRWTAAGQDLGAMMETAIVEVQNDVAAESTDPSPVDTVSTPDPSAVESQAPEQDQAVPREIEDLLEAALDEVIKGSGGTPGMGLEAGFQFLLQEHFMHDNDVERVNNALQSASIEQARAAARTIRHAWAVRAVARLLHIPGAEKIPFAPGASGVEMAIEDDLGRTVWLEVREIPGTVRATLEHVFNRLAPGMIKGPPPDELYVVLIPDRAVAVTSNVIKRVVQSGELALPFPVTIINVGSLTFDSVVHAVDDAIAVPPREAPKAFRVRGRAGYNYLSWDAQADRLYVVRRSVSRTDHWVELAANLAGGEYLDVTAAADVTCVYQVKAVAPDGVISAPAAASVRTRKSGEQLPQSALDWRAELERAVLQPLLESDKGAPLPSVHTVRNALDQIATGGNGVAKKLHLSLLNTLGLSEGSDLTETGVRVHKALQKGKSTELLLRMIYHPAIREVWHILRDGGELRAPSDLLKEWLIVIAEKGALSWDEQQFTWKLPAGTSAQVTPTEERDPVTDHD